MSNARNLASFGSIVGGLTGEIKMWSLPTPPAGYLICDGTSYSTSTYANLFTVIGYTFGGANNSFLVPNYQDRMPIGVNSIANTIGSKGGTANNIISTSNLPAHDHSITDPGHAHSVNMGSTYNSTYTTFQPTIYSIGIQLNTNQSTTGITVNTTQANGNTFPNLALNNMPPYIGIYFIIRYL